MIKNRTMKSELLRLTEAGLFCEAGGFHIDPWRGVDRAIVTHAHADHARWGSRHYLCSEEGRHVTRARLGDVSLETLPYGRETTINGVKVSLHPAGHLLGSAQVRVEHRGEVWVVSGDYKVEPDRTCTGFELVRCHTFITESTFGLPIYRWRPQEEIFEAIGHWWRGNQERGWTSVLCAYSLGKAQRVLGGIDPSIGPILVHGSAVKLNEAYAVTGITLAPWEHATEERAKQTRRRALVIAPPSVLGSAWLRKFNPSSLAMVSGWMRMRGTRRRRSMDRGFALSDHADWPGLQSTIEATGAERIGVTHGYTGPMVCWLREQGREAWAIETHFRGELEDDADAPNTEAPE